MKTSIIHSITALLLLSTFHCAYGQNYYGSRYQLLSATNVGTSLNFSTTGTYEWDWNPQNRRLQSTNKGVDSSTSTTTISFSTNAASTLTFNYAVSSESNYDKLTITLDNSVIINGISGSVSSTYNGNLSQGAHKLIVSYSKDSSESSGEDCACITNMCVATYSGTTGTLTWKVNGETLSIEGNGEMAGYDFDSEDYSPWYCFREEIKYLNISSGCSSISNDAFRYMRNISSVSIPASVRSIFGCAFYGCSNLSSIRFEDSENDLYISGWVDGCYDADDYCPEYVFDGTRISSIYLGRNIPGSSYSDYGFRSENINANLKKLIVGKNVSNVDLLKRITTANCEIEIDNENPYLALVDDVIYNSDKTELLRVLPKKSGTLIIPSTVTSVSSSASSSNMNISSIVIGGHVTIGDFAFYECKNIKYISVDAAIVSVGENAFSEDKYDEDGEWWGYKTMDGITVNYKDLICYYETPRLYIGETLVANQPLNEPDENLVIPEGTTTIGYKKFEGKTTIKSVTLPNSLLSIGGNAFYGCSSLATVEIPNTVTRIEGGAFQYCSGLTSISIGNSVSSIGYNAFYLNASSRLNSVYCYAIEVPENSSSGIFNNSTISGATLYVPAQSLDAYKTAGSWKNFGTILPLPEDPTLVESISIDCESTTLSVGDCLMLTAAVLPENATNTEILWTSDNTGVATVSENGEVTAIAAGEATIIATTTDGSNLSATCRITVAQQVSAGEDTDISLYDDVLYVESAEAAAGQQVKLSIKMNNLVEAQGFQCDLYLPEGVTVATDEDHFPLAELSLERTTAKKTDYFNAVIQSDGALRFLCNSTKGYAFMGNEGEVATVVVEIGDDVDEGELPIILRDIRISDKQSVDHKVAYVKTTLTVSSYTLGDANNDGDISVSDFTAIANHILGNTPANFVEKAADVNTDGDISVGDLTGVANLILYGSVKGAQAAPRRSEAEASQDVQMLDNAIYANTVSAERGQNFVLPVFMKNDMSVRGFQFDMQLPVGITPALDEDGFVIASVSEERTTSRRTDFLKAVCLEDGVLRVLCNSTRGFDFAGSDGEVMQITLNAEGRMEAGDYGVQIFNARLSTGDAVDVVVNARLTSTVEVSSPAGLEFIEADEQSNCYDLYGRRVKAIDGAVIILNNQKVLKK